MALEDIIAQRIALVAAARRRTEGTNFSLDPLREGRDRLDARNARADATAFRNMEFNYRASADAERAAAGDAGIPEPVAAALAPRLLPEDPTMSPEGRKGAMGALIAALGAKGGANLLAKLAAYTAIDRRNKADALLKLGAGDSFLKGFMGDTPGPGDSPEDFALGVRTRATRDGRPEKPDDNEIEGVSYLAGKNNEPFDPKKHRWGPFARGRSDARSDARLNMAQDREKRIADAEQEQRVRRAAIDAAKTKEERESAIKAYVAFLDKEIDNARAAYSAFSADHITDNGFIPKDMAAANKEKTRLDELTKELHSYKEQIKGFIGEPPPPPPVPGLPGATGKKGMYQIGGLVLDSDPNTLSLRELRSKLAAAKNAGMAPVETRELEDFIAQKESRARSLEDKSAAGAMTDDEAREYKRLTGM